VRRSVSSRLDEWRALGDGYRVEVRVVVLAADDVLLVPVAALFPVPALLGEGGDADSNGPAGMVVFVFDQGRAKQRAIDIVARNASVAWVRGGLQAGEPVIVYAPPSVSNGARVRARQP
jgi:HlyD family secretion protein